MMGRTSCDSTVEHRLTLGQFERNQVKELIAQQERNIWLDAIPSIGIGAVGLGAVLGGYALLRWAGVTIENLVDDGTSVFSKYTNKMSDKLVDALPATPAEIRMEQIRDRVLAITKEKRALWEQYNAAPPPPWAARQEILKRMGELEDEEERLRLELDAYATGATSWTNPGN